MGESEGEWEKGTRHTRVPFAPELSLLLSGGLYVLRREERQSTINLIVDPPNGMLAELTPEGKAT